MTKKAAAYGLFVLARGCVGHVVRSLPQTGAGSAPRTWVELHVEDFAPVKQFYGALGFRVAREDLAPDKSAYLVMELDGALLCFWPGNAAVHNHHHFGQAAPHTPNGHHVEIVITVKNLDEVYRKALKLGHDQPGEVIVAHPQTKPWGVRDFRIMDPNGFYLRFAALHDPRLPPPAKPLRPTTGATHPRRSGQ
jgi:lactoylglutathione lyase